MVREAELKRRFREYIDREKLLDGIHTLVVGVSGGADSICLFNLLSDISGEYGLSLIPVHIQHGIRGEEAERDAAFSCRAVALRGGECTVCRVDVPAYAKERGLSEEEAARVLRYRELERMCEEARGDAIALAHHRGDQAETVFMNLLRGAGPAGLIGMEPRRGNRIRPLLFASKKEIVEYLDEYNITYVEDSTNSNTNYTRNRVRMELFPQLESVFAQAQEHIVSVAEDMRIWRDQIRLDAEKGSPLVFDRAGDGPEEAGRQSAAHRERTVTITIDRSAYLNGTEAVRAVWLQEAVDAIVPGKKDISRKHYRALDRLLREGKPGLRLDLPGGSTAESSYDGILICGQRPAVDGNPTVVEEKKTGDSIRLQISGVTEIPENNDFSIYTTELVNRSIFNQKKNDFFEEKDYTKFIDYDRIENGLWLRHPTEGDYFVMDASGDRKKLSRWYIDRKVPRAERALQEVIADGSHIVWAVPDRISEYYKVTDETKRVLMITRSERN